MSCCRKGRRCAECLKGGGLRLRARVRSIRKAEPDLALSDAEWEPFRIASERDALLEFFEAHEAVERAVTDFDDHAEAVERLRAARDRVVKILAGAE